jgi:hypothetical protein
LLRKESSSVEDLKQKMVRITEASKVLIGRYIYVGDKYSGKYFKSIKHAKFTQARYLKDKGRFGKYLETSNRENTEEIAPSVSTNTELGERYLQISSSPAV